MLRVAHAVGVALATVLALGDLDHLHRRLQLATTRSLATTAAASVAAGGATVARRSGSVSVYATRRLIGRQSLGVDAARGAGRRLCVGAFLERAHLLRVDAAIVGLLAAQRLVRLDALRVEADAAVEVLAVELLRLDVGVGAGVRRAHALRVDARVLQLLQRLEHAYLRLARRVVQPRRVGVGGRWVGEHGRRVGGTCHVA